MRYVQVQVLGNWLLPGHWLLIMDCSHSNCMSVTSLKESHNIMLAFVWCACLRAELGEGGTGFCSRQWGKSSLFLSNDSYYTF